MILHSTLVKYKSAALDASRIVTEVSTHFHWRHENVISVFNFTFTIQRFRFKLISIKETSIFKTEFKILIKFIIELNKGFTMKTNVVTDGIPDAAR